MSMIRSHICNVLSVVSFMMLLAVLYSCVGVEVDSSDITEQTDVYFDVVWPSGLAQTDIPEDILVVMSRTHNQPLHYVYDLDNSGNIISPVQIEDVAD